MNARKSREEPERCSGNAGNRRPASLRSNKRVRFDEEESRGETVDRQEGAIPRSDWRPDQVAVAEGAKRQRKETEDAANRESKDTGGSSGSDD